VDAGRVDAVAELHGVVDLGDEQLAVAALQEVDGHHPPAHGIGGTAREAVGLGRHRTVGGVTAAGGVGYPVLRLPVDGADGLAAHHEAADVPSRLVDVLLDVKDGVGGGAAGALGVQPRPGGV